jgi:hypothetical protein
MADKKDIETPTVAELKAMNIDRASRELNEILRKYDCTLSSKVLITSQGIQFSIDIVSN